MGIIIGADFVPTKSNESLFQTANANDLLGPDLIDILADADYRIFNLEMPFCDKETPISKCGPCLCASTSTANLYRKIHVDLVTLANNHIMDHGEEGLRNTLKTLSANGIAFFGVGENSSYAGQPYIINSGEKTIGLYGCVEHEFSVAKISIPGANPYDPLTSYDHVKSLKNNCDYVIVLYHGGKEFYRYPSPELQRICRKFVESGADLVLCQHSHCIGCKEVYNNSTIVYGQGNFLFDHGDNEFWGSGLLVRIGTDFTLQFVPVIKKGATVRLATEEQKEKILSAFENRSNQIKSDGFIEEQYRSFASESLNRYLLSMYGITKRNILFRIVNKVTGYHFEKWVLKKRYRKDSLLYLLNYTECESQRELFIEGIRGRIDCSNGQSRG